MLDYICQTDVIRLKFNRQQSYTFKYYLNYNTVVLKNIVKHYYDIIFTYTIAYGTVSINDLHIFNVSSVTAIFVVLNYIWLQLFNFIFENYIIYLSHILIYIYFLLQFFVGLATLLLIMYVYNDHF